VANGAAFAVRRWLADRLADARVAAEYASAVPELASPGWQPGGRRRSAELERLLRHLSLVQEEHAYRGAWLVNRAGRLIGELAGSPPLDSAHLALAGRVMRSGAAGFGEPSLRPDSSVRLSFAAPVVAPPHRVVGAVLIELDPVPVLVPLLSGGRSLGATAGLRLMVRVGSDVAMLTPVDSPPSRPLTLRVPWADVAEVSRFALTGVDRFGSFVSSTGVPILAATRHIPEAGWGLIARIEQREAFAEYRSRLRTEVLLAIALTGAFGLGIFTIVRSARLAQWRERAQAAVALEASERRYRQLFESSLDYICTHDLQGVVLSANRATAQALGFADPAACVGRRLEEFLAPAVRPGFADYLARIVANGTDAGLVRVLTAAGEERIWEYQNVLVRESGRETYVLANARDITERRAAEEALRRSEQSYRNLVERAAYGIYRSTLDGRLLAVNPALVRMLGYSSEAELLAVDMARDLYLVPEERDRLIAQHGQADHIEGLEVDWKRKDGTPIRVRLSGTALRDDKGQVVAFEMIVEDVTERRALEAQLRQAQKMEAVGQLTGGIAHDFNNLLTVILANAELIAKALPPEESDLKRDLEELQGAARRGAAMVRKLLAFSRREELRLRPVDLPRLVADLEGVLRRLVPEHISLSTEIAENLPPVLADPGAVEQVLLNLVTNARDAMPNGGSLVIGIAPAAAEEGHRGAQAASAAGYVRLSVRDTGTGMDEATLAHLFEPFFTTKPPGVGTGLGMAMVYGLVKQQNGFVEVQSRWGAGTTVHVYLPAASAEPAPRGPKPQARSPGGAETILLVEDEEGIRRSASRVLARAGYRVLVACDGEEALALYRQHRDEIALVISDVVMPRLGGTELYRALEREPKPPKFIFTSGYAAREVADRAALERAGPLLQKPWDMDDFLRRVRQALDGG